MQEQYRQGDLLFVRRKRVPAGLKARLGQVIVRGEATGHAHRLTTGTILHGSDDALYLRLQQEARVVHEEHAPLLLPAGIWQVVRQREYVPPALGEEEPTIRQPEYASYAARLVVD